MTHRLQVNVHCRHAAEPHDGRTEPVTLGDLMPGQKPVPVQGAHDLEPTSNKGVWPVPITIR